MLRLGRSRVAVSVRTLMNDRQPGEADADRDVSSQLPAVRDSSS